MEYLLVQLPGFQFALSTLRLQAIHGDLAAMLCELEANELLAAA